MRVRPFVVAALFGCCLLAVVGALSAPAAAQSIDVEHTLAQNDADGQVDVRTALDVPGGTTTLEITIPEGTEVYESRGFSQVGERTYEWTKTTNQPYLRYSMEGNVTLDRGRGEEYLYAVTDEWAVVRTPNIRLDWTGVRADVDVSATADGEGVAVATDGETDASAVVDDFTAEFGGGGGGSETVAQAGGFDADPDDLVAFLRTGDDRTAEP